jgi:hypothetical protein
MSMTRREIRAVRRAVGPEVAATVARHAIRLSAHTSLLRRGFWGRLKWLLFGR